MKSFCELNVFAPPFYYLFCLIKFIILITSPSLTLAFVILAHVNKFMKLITSPSLALAFVILALIKLGLKYYLGMNRTSSGKQLNQILCPSTKKLLL